MIPIPERPTPFWSWFDAILFFSPIGLLFVVPMVMAPPGVTAKPTMAGLILEFGIFGGWLLALAMYFRVRYDRPFWSSLGWTGQWPAKPFAYLLGPALAVGLGLLGAALNAPQVDPLGAVVTSPGTAAVTGLFAVLIGPLVEELIFRGFLLPLAVRALGAAAGIVAVALPFALLHGPQYQWSWQQLILLVAASCTFGWVRVAYTSTKVSALVHGGYNLVFFVAYLFQRKDLFT